MGGETTNVLLSAEPDGSVNLNLTDQDGNVVFEVPE